MLFAIFMKSFGTKNTSSRRTIAAHWIFLSLYYIGALLALQNWTNADFVVPAYVSSFFSQAGLLLANAFLVMGLWELFYSVNFSKKTYVSLIGIACFISAILQAVWKEMLPEDRFIWKVGPQMLLTATTYTLAGLYFCPCLNKRFEKLRAFKSSFSLNIPLLIFAIVKFTWFFVYLNDSFGPYLRYNTGLLLFLVQVAVSLAIGIGMLRVTLLLEEEHLAKVSSLVRQNQIHGELGQLSAGIVHDINNCVSVINMSAELAKTQLRKGAPPEVIERKLDVIFDRAKTISQTSSEMLDSIRAQTISVNKKYPIEPDQALTVLEPALQMIVPGHIDLKMNFGLPVGKKVCCALNDFEMIVLNLVKNSVDAIESREVVANKGWIRIRSELVTVVDDRSTSDLIEYVKLTVEDNGCGMTAEVLDRSTEVEFSTKGKKGSGFGLANVQGFVSDLKGRFSIDSEVGKGTTVKLLMPVDLPCVVVATEDSEVAQEANSNDWNTVNLNIGSAFANRLPANGGVVLLGEDSSITESDLIARLSEDQETTQWSVLEMVNDTRADHSDRWRDRGIAYSAIHVRHTVSELHTAIRDLLNLELADKVKVSESRT